MIQRIQTVWLFLASLLGGATFKLPFYTGDWQKDNLPNTPIDLNAQTTLVHTIITALAIIVSLAAIILYKNRRLQSGVTGMAMGITAGLLVLYFIETRQFTGGGISPWSAVYFAILIFLWLGIRGIRKDEKLIRSMDRLR
jgi:lipopolysaccharide export LptBFGC system permease protein LptF